MTTRSTEEFDCLSRADDARELLCCALKTLSPEERAVVSLVHLQGRATAEAADLMGWSVANTMVRLFWARKKLRSYVESVLAEASRERA